jgi:methionyl-tRNA formyltransferase
MRFAAFGRTRWLFDSILALKEAGHEVTLIGTAPASPEYSVGEEDFRRLAERLGCDYFFDSSINRIEHVAKARSLCSDVAISVNWPTLIGAEMRAAFTHGIINAHAGDLPRFRGNACPNWAILNGEEKVVLSLHQMNQDLDAGPILQKKHFSLTESTYIGDIYKFLDYAIPVGFAEALSSMENGATIFTEQSKDPLDSLRCFPRMPGDSGVNWTLSAKELSKLVRASSEPFAGAFALLNGERLIIWRARAEIIPYPSLGVCGQVVHIDADQGEAWILCGEGALVLEQVEFRGVNSKPTDFIHSSRTRLSTVNSCAEQLSTLNSRIDVLERFIRDFQGTNNDAI